jgi:hypothetical protein
VSVEEQRQVCDAHGAPCEPPDPSSRVGIALHTLHLTPLHGLRTPPHVDMCGWYLWGGEWSDEPDFFQPLCVRHLPERCPLAVRFLGLPPGWRFLTDGEVSDVWLDRALIQSR